MLSPTKLGRPFLKAWVLSSRRGQLNESGLLQLHRTEPNSNGLGLGRF